MFLIIICKWIHKNFSSLFTTLIYQQWYKVAFVLTTTLHNFNTLFRFTIFIILSKIKLFYIVVHQLYNLLISILFFRLNRYVITDNYYVVGVTITLTTDISTWIGDSKFQSRSWAWRVALDWKWPGGLISLLLLFLNRTLVK